ncbi:MAG: hypothetical protein CVT60_05210 [Actinobacteria bacterium HGW-Actinobacteria-10]|jgi:hypothetical protein|nr:MAG: hypothetical protein CVT60_05210 [Actinobacteria bacterium HGW-Actinobacteria-10]
MPETTNKSRKRKGIIFALLLTLIALAVVAGAVVWAGGIQGVSEILGLGGGDNVAIVPGTRPPRTPDSETSNEPTTTGSTESTLSAEETVVAGVSGDDDEAASDSGSGGSGGDVTTQGTFPASAAAEAMYREQLHSQWGLTELAENKWASFSMGIPTVSATKAVVPITVTSRSGGTMGASMTIANSDGLWYFSSFAGIDDDSQQPVRVLDSGVVSTLSDQQATDSNQELIRKGIVEHGFVTCRVDGVARGSGTATVNVTLLGGSLDRQAARFVMITKDEGGKKYWFVTRFELK